MSEKPKLYEVGPEHSHHPEHHEHNSKAEVNHEALKEDQNNLLETSRETAELQAAPSKLLAIEKNQEPAGHDVATHQAIKKESYNSLLKTTRQHLPTITRQFSKVIHEKHVEAISNIGGQTVARPSGLLGGGLGALAGSITLLYYSKYYGFRYNYSFFLVTFLAGFLVGLVVELIVRLLKKR